MVPILILLLCLPYNVYGIKSFKKLHLPSLGSEAFAFDTNNNNTGPYTTLNDGRIVKYTGNKLGFIDFATTTPNRSKKICDGTDGNNVTTALICGKPLGIEINQKTGDLYILDAYHGLFVVGKGGGMATLLSGDMHWDFADGIDIDQNTGIVYITDLGSIFTRTTNMTEILLRADDRTGRLLKYDPTTKQTTLLRGGLAMPAGLAVSADGSFVLITEYLTSNITKYYVKGSKANTTENLVTVPGNPDNIKRTTSGDFWIAVNIQKLQPALTVFPLGQKINSDGKILKTVNFYGDYNATYITEVQEYRGKFYVASIFTNFAGVYKKLSC